MREWKKRNPKRAKELNNESYARHRDKARAREASWRSKNIDRARAIAAASGRKNRAKQTEGSRRWRQANPLKVAANNHRRRARSQSGGRHATGAQLEELFASYSALCVYCNGRATTVDHVMSLSRGGSNGVENLVPACEHCNSSKGHAPLLVWMARRAA